eukprot:3704320-Pleurochrysis_carterae.AAC.1
MPSAIWSSVRCSVHAARSHAARVRSEAYQAHKPRLQSFASLSLPALRAVSRKRLSDFVKCRFRPQYVLCLARQSCATGRASSFSLLRFCVDNLCIHDNLGRTPSIAFGHV